VTCKQKYNLVAHIYMYMVDLTINLKTPIKNTKLDVSKNTV
jgi:hypothetical protein